MKKLFAVLLALVMMALPVLGMAASPSEMLMEAVDAGRPWSGKIAFEVGALPGLDAESMTITKDLMGALGATFTMAENKGQFALTLSGEDAINFAFEAGEEDTYLQSNLLGKKALAFNAEEGKVILGYLKNLAVEAGVMTEADFAEFEAAIAQASTQVSAQMEPVAFEEADLAGLTAFGAELVAKMQISEVTQQPRNSDTATTLVTMTLTGEDVSKFYTEIFKLAQKVPQVRQMLSAMGELSFNGEPVTVDEFMEKLPELGAQMGDMFQGDIPVEVYLDEADNVVYAVASMIAKGEEEGKETTVAIDMDYSRLTVNNGAAHAVNVIGKDPSNNGVAITVNVLDTEKVTSVNVGVASIADGVSEPVIQVDVNVEGEYGETESEEEADVEITITDSESKEEFAFRFEAESEAKKVGDDVVYEEEVDFYIKGVEEKILCVKLNLETGKEPAAINTSDVVRLGQMTEEQFNTFLSKDLSQNAYMALMGAMQKLPTSVLMLFVPQ